jgi:hypothetical protein
VDDWRYETLRDDVGRLRKEIREVEGRTYKVETWQSLLPLRVMMGSCWLFSAGMIMFTIIRAAAQ